jgi:hypothetical protein
MVAQKHLCAILLTTIIIGASFGAAAAQRGPEETGPLFIPVGPGETAGKLIADRQPDLAVTRSRNVRIDWGSLQAATPGETLQLNLFEDVNVNAVVSSVTEENGTVTWVGQVVDDPMAQAFLVSSDGQVAVDVHMPDGIYQVRSAGGDLHTVQQIDQSAYPEEMPPIEIGPDQLAASAADLKAAAPAASDAPVSEDDGGTLDVLVLYTPRARSTAGSQTAMTNLVNLAVAETNQSYANSGISQRIRLVSTQEIAYTESGSMDSDLSNLQSASDSYMNQVHTLRNTYGADLVSLIVESGQYCGIAYMMQDISSYFQAYAFSVVARSCATGYYSFAHELGHNMGARHDWYTDTSSYPDTYGHGYVNVSGRWRTIMAYDSECTVNGFSCTRLQYWSNPGITRNGQPMGVSAGTNSSCQAHDKYHPPCDADDHRTLNTTAYTVANFRLTVANPTPTTTPRPLSSYPFKNFLPSIKR